MDAPRRVNYNRCLPNDETPAPLTRRNAFYAQSGGVTAVINASACGVIQTARQHKRSIGRVYAGRNGIIGALTEDLIDTGRESSRAIAALMHTPAGAFGSCRYKLAGIDRDKAQYERLLDVFRAHDIGYFFYNGGNDSADTCLKVSQMAARLDYPLIAVHVPKTVDNDLAVTDCCPGFGSVAKYNATTVMEIAADVSSMATDDGACCLVEVMGRGAGWIAASAVLAKRAAQDAPHIILLPEIPFNESAFLSKVKEIVDALKFCMVVVGEGLKNPDGKEFNADTSRLDAFGHPVLSGAGERLAEIVLGKLNIKTRTVKLGYAQRCAAHYASATDAAEARACGEAAVRAAIQGQSGFMVKIIRTQNNPYRWTTGLQPLGDIANVEHVIPRDWISEDGFMPTEKFVEYARPLIEGEVKFPTEGGLPKFVRLGKTRVEKKLPSRG